jgi:chromosome segregation ATPase
LATLIATPNFSQWDREDVRETVASVLRLFAKDLVSNRLNDAVSPSEPNPNATQPSSKIESRRDVAVQSTQIDANQVNGQAESRSASQAPRETSANPEVVLANPFPGGEEALRAEIAVLSARVIEQESSIRSLEQVAVNLRDTTAGLLAQLQDHHRQVREAEDKELTQSFERTTLRTNLERAAIEVATLRSEIRNFHQPTSRLYQSIKDAVLREMRGEGNILWYKHSWKIY